MNRWWVDRVPMPKGGRQKRKRRVSPSKPQMLPMAFKDFIKNRRINIDLVSRRVDELLEVPICYKCSRFGHVLKYCTEKPRCYKCGGTHEGKDCQTVELNCTNCEFSGVEKSLRPHTATDKKCPIYGKKIEINRRNINYNG